MFPQEYPCPNVPLIQAVYDQQIESPLSLLPVLLSSTPHMSP